jgi:protein scribble
VTRRKKISLISDQDLRTIKLEEEKKFGTLTREEIRKSMDFDQDFQEEEEEAGMIEKIADIPPDTSNVVEPKSPPPVVERKRLTARERLNPRYMTSSMASSVSSDDDAIRSLEEEVLNVTQNYDETPSSDQSAVQRLSRGLDDRLQVTSPDVKHDVTQGNDLSPAERRALEAEKRKQWRQARKQSLENDIRTYNTLRSRLHSGGSTSSRSGYQSGPVSPGGPLSPTGYHHYGFDAAAQNRFPAYECVTCRAIFTFVCVCVCFICCIFLPNPKSFC